MYALALVLALLQPVMDDGASSQRKQTISQQPAGKNRPTVSQGSATPSTPQHEAEASEHQANPKEARYAVDVKSQPSPEDAPLFKWYLIATAIGVAVNAFILAAIWRQTKLNRTATKAAKRSAKAAKRSADVAERTMIRSNRPWLGICEAPIITEPLRAEGNNIGTTIFFKIKNYGPSPALHVNVDVSMGFDTWNKDPKEFFQQFDAATDSSYILASMGVTAHLTTVAIGGETAQVMSPPTGITIFPNDTSEFLIKHQTNITDQRDLSRALRFIGCVAYGDQFSDTTVHHTRFSYATNTPARSFIPSDGLRQSLIVQDAD
jgi:hypothetical protein